MSAATTNETNTVCSDEEDDYEVEEREREALLNLQRGTGPGAGPAMYANTRKSMKGVDSDITDSHSTSSVVKQSIVNALAHSMKGTVKGQDTRGRVSRETYSTSGGVIDEKSIGVVRKWINIGVIDSVRGVVATGKTQFTNYMKHLLLLKITSNGNLTRLSHHDLQEKKLLFIMQ